MQYSEDTNPTAQAIRRACKGSWSMYRKTLFLSQVIGNGAMHLSTLEPSFSVLWNAPSRKSSCCPWAQARGRGCSSWLTVQAVSMQEWNCLKILKDCRYWDYRFTFVKGLQILLVFALSESGCKIISGDNPVTISYIAQQAGFKKL